METLNINEDIAVHIMNWGLLDMDGVSVYFHNGEDLKDKYSFKIVCKIDEFKPSENINDAMKVMGQLMTNGWEFEVVKYLENTKYEWRTVLVNGNKKIQGYGKTRAESICDAAIKTITK